MRIERAPASAAPHRVGARQLFTEGWKYAFGFRPIRSIIMLLALVSLVGVPYSVLMPVFATEVFHGVRTRSGFLMTASGGGALVGALWLATRKSVIGLGRIIALASASFGVGLIAFFVRAGPAGGPPLSGARGFGFMVQMASSNTSSRRSSRTESAAAS